MILPITLTIAGAAALINIWLGWRCGQIRTREKIFIGDGGNPLLVARMRAHANFIEYTPIVLILIGLIELAEGTSPWLWTVGVVYVLARICHGFGMDGVVRLRVIGTVVTMLTLAGLGICALVIPFASGGRVSEAVTIGSAPASAPAAMLTLPRVSLQ
ncbi:MAPEG family protein [Sphingomonas flavalba]|uniref:MAPEG family protein n=1 Tax=Sphingomonas flavalba TaxID=2559804 RepID=UPI0039E1151E